MDLTAVPGLAQTRLGPELAACLPEAAPPAPWALELRALLWTSLPRASAARDLPSALASRSRLLAGGGGLIHYLDTPVGPYSELLAAGLLLHGGRPATHVPFMAVDSEESVVGGRANWALPKTLARFDGEPGATAAMRARGDGWELRASARPLGPVLPFRVRMALVQEWPDGRVRPATGRLAGRARLAWVTLEASGGPDLLTWLHPGGKLGVIVEHARGTLGPAVDRA